MRIEHINDEFGDISTAVVYKFHKFLPIYKNREGTVRYEINKNWVKSIEDKYVPSRIFYQGGLKKFDDIDFAEYDFRYVLENHKFNSRSLLSYLDSESRDMVGKNRGNLNQINSLIFPTIGKDSDSGFEYFNSLLISSTSAYLFSLNPGEYRIELFEDTLESGNYKDPEKGWIFRSFDYIQAMSTTFLDESMSIEFPSGSVVLRGKEYYVAQSKVSGIDPAKDESGVWVKVIKPDTLILLGPDAYSDKNRVDYYSGENMVNGLWRESETLENQAHLEDEIYSGKVVWLAISPANNVRELNLSYAAWLNSEDANRYKNKFNLRNDEYYGNSLDITRKDEDTEVYRDVRSGRILGTEINDKCPILKKKLRRIVSGEYNPEIEYPLNSVVTYEGKQFTAIMKNNRGHFPNMSPHWVLSEKLIDYYTKRLTILPEPIGGGHTIPGKQITLMDPDKSNLSCRFQVIENLGYTLGGLAWENNQGDREDLVVNEDYTVTDYSTPEVIYRYVEINRNGLDKILKEESRKRIIFNFSTVKSILNLGECYVNGDLRFITKLENLEPGKQYVYLGKLKVNGVEISDYTDKLQEGFNVGDEVEYTLYLLDMNRVNIDDDGTTPYRFEECTLLTSTQDIITSHSIDVSNSKVIDSISVGGDDFIKNVPCITASTTVDYTNSSFNIKLTNTRKVVVEQFDEFEVSSTLINSAFNITTQVEILFYGTYRDCLDYIEVNGSKLSEIGVEHGVIGAIVKIIVDGKSSIGTTKYKLQLRNIYKDVTVKLIAKTE